MKPGVRNLMVCLGLVGVFAFGVVTGVFGTGAYIHHHIRGLHGGGHGPERMESLGVAWLDWELDLDDSQHASIGEIVRDVHLELFRFKTAHSDEVQAIVMRGLERIDAELTPGQAERWAPLRGRLAEHAAAKLEE